MLTACCFALLLSRPIPAPPPPRLSPAMRAAIVALVVGKAADLGTTFPLSGNLYEANPMFGRLSQHPAAMIAVSSAITVAQVYLLRKLARDHPKLALGIAWGLAGLSGTVAILNARTRWGQ